jgi:hypothetical protein
MDFQIAKYHYPIHPKKRCQGDPRVWKKTHSLTMPSARQREFEKRWGDGGAFIRADEVRGLAHGPPLEIS